MDENRPFWRLVIDEWVWLVTSSFSAAVVSVFGLFGVPMAGWVALLLFFFGIVVAVWAAGKHAYENYRTLVRKLTSERDSALDRLKPKLEITEDGDGGSSRIRVRSLFDSSCRFGAEITAITPAIEELVAKLPFALRLVSEPGERMELLPARGIRTVEVIEYDRPGGWRFLGTGKSTLRVREGLGEPPLSVTITAYCDKEGASVEMRFGIAWEANPRLWALSPCTTASESAAE